MNYLSDMDHVGRTIEEYLSHLFPSSTSIPILAIDQRLMKSENDMIFIHNNQNFSTTTAKL